VDKFYHGHNRLSTKCECPKYAPLTGNLPGFIIQQLNIETLWNNCPLTTAT